jgi:hypothetical protein
MAELISKQAAIYAIKVHAESVGTDIKAYQLAHRHLAEVIEILPAAESERVLCRDCKRYNRHDHRCTVWNHGIHTDDWCSRAERR